MGHRITTQSRGKGGPTYRAPSHRYKAELKHIGDDTQTITGSVIDIEHDPARNAPIAVVKLEDGAKVYMLVTEGLGIGETITWGSDVEVKNGLQVFRQLLLIRLRTGSVSGCPVERPNGLTNDAGQPSELLPVAVVLTNRL
jgi:hypothetical protein